MKISASQRKALEAAGYTISKSGSTVQSKNGGTVGGYNENGNIFSGSKVVRDILKGTAETPKAAPKAAPKAKPVIKDAMAGYRKGDVTTTSLDKPKGGRGDGGAEKIRRLAGAALDRVATPKPATSNKTDKMRGDARTAARSRTSINSTKKKIRELQGQLDKNSATLAAASLGSGTLTRGSSAAKGKPSNPTYGSQRLSPEGPQGRMNTTVGRPAVKTGGKGINAAKMAGRIRGGRQATIDRAKDPLMLD